MSAWAHHNTSLPTEMESSGKGLGNVSPGCPSRSLPSAGVEGGDAFGYKMGSQIMSAVLFLPDLLPLDVTCSTDNDFVQGFISGVSQDSPISRHIRRPWWAPGGNRTTASCSRLSSTGKTFSAWDCTVTLRVCLFVWSPTCIFPCRQKPSSVTLAPSGWMWP